MIWEFYSWVYIYPGKKNENTHIHTYTHIHKHMIEYYSAIKKD